MISFTYKGKSYTVNDFSKNFYTGNGSEDSPFTERSFDTDNAVALAIEPNDEMTIAVSVYGSLEYQTYEYFGILCLTDEENYVELRTKRLKAKATYDLDVTAAYLLTAAEALGMWKGSLKRYTYKLESDIAVAFPNFETANENV